MRISPHAGLCPGLGLSGGGADGELHLCQAVSALVGAESFELVRSGPAAAGEQEPVFDLLVTAVPEVAANVTVDVWYMDGADVREIPRLSGEKVALQLELAVSAYRHSEGEEPPIGPQTIKRLVGRYSSLESLLASPPGGALGRGVAKLRPFLEQAAGEALSLSGSPDVSTSPAPGSVIGKIGGEASLIGSSIRCHEARGDSEWVGALRGARYLLVQSMSGHVALHTDTSTWFLVAEQLRGAALRAVIEQVRADGAVTLCISSETLSGPLGRDCARLFDYELRTMVYVADSSVRGDQSDAELVEAVVGGSARALEEACLPMSHRRGALIMALGAVRQVYATLREQGTLGFYLNVEKPMTSILAGMTSHGVLVDRGSLKKSELVLQKELAEVTTAFSGAVGREVVLSKPADVAAALFDELKMELSAKGRSTSASALAQLQGDPAVDALLRGRQLQTLLSSTVRKLPGHINGETGRVHAQFRQTTTATGRLSCAEPNLQGTPSKSVDGALIRQAFMPSDGYKLLGMDYSQIELRVLAHLSGEEVLIEAFRAGEDIHQRTGDEIFGGLGLSGSERRRRAKAVNFGIIYGLTAHGLAPDLGVSTDEAEGYIQTYLQRLPRVGEYLSALRQQSAKGYVSTLYGRRIAIPVNTVSRARRERMAQNAPMQGSASDIIKRAMVLSDRYIREQGLDAHMLLQVHDELLFEVDSKSAEVARLGLKSCMENAAQLIVPLLVDDKLGQSWAAVH